MAAAIQRHARARATLKRHTAVTPSQPSSPEWSGASPIWVHTPPIRSIASRNTVPAASCQAAISRELEMSPRGQTLAQPTSAPSP